MWQNAVKRRGQTARYDPDRHVYGHLEKALVKEGNHVKAGTLISLADDKGHLFCSFDE